MNHLSNFANWARISLFRDKKLQINASIAVSSPYSKRIKEFNSKFKVFSITYPLICDIM
jgi:hypothetical protein